MSMNASRDTPAHPTKTAPACRGRDGRKAAHNDRDEETPKTVRSQLQLQNSRITLEYGRAGIIGRITRQDGTTEYAGPLDEETIAALRQVSEP